MATSGTEVVIDDVSDARVSGLSMAERADLLRTGKCRTGTDVTMKIADAKAAEIRTAWGKFARKPAGVVCSSVAGTTGGAVTITDLYPDDLERQKNCTGKDARRRGVWRTCTGHVRIVSGAGRGDGRRDCRRNAIRSRRPGILVTSVTRRIILPLLPDYGINCSW